MTRNSLAYKYGSSRKAGVVAVNEPQEDKAYRIGHRYDILVVTAESLLTILKQNNSLLTSMMYSRPSFACTA